MINCDGNNKDNGNAADSSDTRNDFYGGERKSLQEFVLQMSKAMVEQSKDMAKFQKDIMNLKGEKDVLAQRLDRISRRVSLMDNKRGSNKATPDKTRVSSRLFPGIINLSDESDSDKRVKPTSAMSLRSRNRGNVRNSKLGNVKLQRRSSRISSGTVDLCDENNSDRRVKSMSAMSLRSRNQVVNEGNSKLENIKLKRRTRRLSSSTLCDERNSGTRVKPTSAMSLRSRDRINVGNVNVERRSRRLSTSTVDLCDENDSDKQVKSTFTISLRSRNRDNTGNSKLGKVKVGRRSRRLNTGAVDLCDGSDSDERVTPMMATSSRNRNNSMNTGNSKLEKVKFERNAKGQFTKIDKKDQNLEETLHNEVKVEPLEEDRLFEKVTCTEKGNSNEEEGSTTNEDSTEAISSSNDEDDDFTEEEEDLTEEEDSAEDDTTEEKDVSDDEGGITEDDHLSGEKGDSVEENDLSDEEGGFTEDDYLSDEKVDSVEEGEFTEEDHLSDENENSAEEKDLSDNEGEFAEEGHLPDEKDRLNNEGGFSEEVRLSDEQGYSVEENDSEDGTTEEKDMSDDEEGSGTENCLSDERADSTGDDTVSTSRPALKVNEIHPKWTERKLKHSTRSCEGSENEDADRVPLMFTEKPYHSLYMETSELQTTVLSFNQKTCDGAKLPKSEVTNELNFPTMKKVILTHPDFSPETREYCLEENDRNITLMNEIRNREMRVSHDQWKIIEKKRKRWDLSRRRQKRKEKLQECSTKGKRESSKRCQNESKSHLVDGIGVSGLGYPVTAFGIQLPTQSYFRKMLEKEGLT